MYEPLPKGLKIQKSEISGQGLFTLLFLKKDTDLGMSHIVLNHDPKENDDELIRTPLGGHINHSDTPNCIKVRGVLGREDVEDYDKYFLYTERPIKAWEELTVKYTFYNVKNELGTK